MKNRLLTIVLAFLPLMSWGQGTTDPQPYARLAEDDNNNLVLTFYYNLDKNDSDFGIGPFTSASDRGWHSSRANIKEVVFDESFASYDGLSSMNVWFYQMSGLTKVTGISNLNTANVTSLRSTFNGCSSLTTLDLSSLNTSEVKEMNFMFDGCSSLTDLKVGFSTEKVTTMANMFLGCSSLTTLDLSTFNTANVKSNMDYMFSSCSALTTIYVSDLWTTENVTSGNEMFNACQSLVGGQGTTFSTSHRGLDYAHIDGGTANPGYFTNGTAIIEFADAKVKEICIDNWDTNGDGELSTVEAAAVTSLGKKFSGTTITSFDELQYFRGLTVLDEGEFSNCPNLASVIVPEGVTSIGYYGFHDCPLASVTLPSTLTSIGGGAFEGCEKLTSITIPVGVTELSRRVLCGCSSLTSIVLPTSLTTIGESALEGCVSLHEIDIPESVTELGPNAINNTGLTSVTIPAGVTSISERAFMNSAALTSVTSQIVNPYAIPDDVFSEYVYQNAPLFVPTGSVDAYKNTDGWKQFMYILAIGDTLRLPYAVLTDSNTVLTFYYDDQKEARGGININNSELVDAPSPYGTATSAVFDASFANYYPTSTAYWFQNCSALTSISGVENLKTSNVTNMSEMFNGCSGLTSLDVSGFKTANVTSMYGMFHGCLGLTSLDVSSFNTSNVTNMSQMFNGCSGLTSLDVTGFNTANVTDMAGMFYYCSGLTSLDVSGFNTANVTNMSWMFEGCSSLTSLDVSGFKTDNVTRMDYMFQFCSGLSVLDVTGFKTENVTNMTYMFMGCSSLTSLDVSGFNTANVTGMLRMFADCSSLTSLDLSAFNTANVTNMGRMFEGCSSLTSLDVSGFNTSNVTDMYWMFWGCSGLTSLDMSGFNTANVTDMSGMFIGCSGLTSLDVSSFNTANVTYMYGMFIGCSGLKTIYVGNDWSTASVTESNEMFSGCTNLVGGMGTVYNPDHVDATYAHIDGGTSNPGYFTLSGDGPYVPVDVTFDNHGVLTVGGTATMAEALETVGGVSAVAETVTAVVWNSTATLTNSDLQDLDNPNMLVYVPSVSQAPVNRDNVIIGNDNTGYTAKNIVLTDVESGNQNFYCPKAFVAEMITYAHDYLQQTEVGVSRGWETIALPFTVQTIMHEKQGVIAPFGNDASNKHFWLRQLMMQGLTRATVIEANMPYLIAMPNSDTYAAEFNLNGRVTFSSQNVEVPQTQMNVMEVHDANDNMMMFVPCFQVQPQGQEIYALNVGEQRDNHPEGSVFEANYREVHPFEAFTVHNGNGPAPRFVLISEMMGGATEIEDVRSKMSDGRGDNWYDMNGRKLQKEPTRKGVYLNNGRKVVVQK